MDGYRAKELLSGLLELHDSPIPLFLKALLLFIYHWLGLSAFLLHHASILSTVKSHCLSHCPFFFLPHCLIPYTRWGMSSSRKTWDVRHIAANICHYILISSFHFLCVYQSVSVLDVDKTLIVLQWPLCPTEGVTTMWRYH